MKKTFAMTVMALAAGMCAAQDVGRVISAMPVQQQVAVPRQVCTNEQVVVQAPKSGAGLAMGAIAGGVLGNAIGSGGGRALATFIGLIGGAMLGDRVEGGGISPLQNVQSCNTQVFLENRVVAYDVLYECAGKRYSVQMPRDPGPSIRVQITPVGATVQDGVGQYGAARYLLPPVQAPVAVGIYNPHNVQPHAPYPLTNAYRGALSGGEVNPGN